MNDFDRSDLEYQAFMKSYDMPPKGLDERVLKEARTDVRSRYFIAFIKVFGMHLLAGAATLAICPQFGWNPFNAPEALPHAFMSYGMWACGLFCGAFFMGTGAFLNTLLLSNATLGTYQARIWTGGSLLCAFFFTFLMLIGRQEAPGGAYLGLAFAASWIGGALLFEIVPNLLWRKKSFAVQS